MSKKSPPEAVTLTFDLHDLPTAQHRAGLSGLILQIDAMGPDGYRKSPKLVLRIDELRPTSATITFTRESMQGVFDELYAAKSVPIVVATKWPGKTPPKPGPFFLRKKDPKTGEMKDVPGFGYDVVQPRAPALHRHLREEGNAWLELWRQMLWAIPRGGNNVRSRAPFIDTAGDSPCGEGLSAWAQVVEFEDRRTKNEFKTAPISGALMLGAQAINAESVPFSGRVDHNLLLHFWQLVVMTFVPRVVSKKEGKAERLGYVLAIPDVADLAEFRREFPAILDRLVADHPKHTPAGARIDLPDQASLEVLRRLDDREAPRANLIEPEGNAAPVPESRPRRGVKPGAGPRKESQDLAGDVSLDGWRSCVRAVESYHMFKLGNNVKILSFARVAARPKLVAEYRRILANYRNPLFRAARMRGLIDRRPWHWGMVELFSEYPAPFFVDGDQTPRYLPRFGRDARSQFQTFQKDLKGMTIETMNDEERVAHLGVIIQRLASRYVEGRAEVKTGKKVKDIKKAVIDGKERRLYPPEFREAQQRVCSDAFLAIRSRHDQDFVAYFAGSICSVAQFLPADDYRFLIRVLMTRPDPSPVKQPGLTWEDVKSIAMIALSGLSFTVRPREAETPAKGTTR